MLTQEVSPNSFRTPWNPCSSVHPWLNCSFWDERPGDTRLYARRGLVCGHEHDCGNPGTRRDGTLHLPVLPAWRKTLIRVKAELEPSAGAPAMPGPFKGFGCLRGKIRMAPDFDEPLEDFKDYMG